MEGGMDEAATKSSVPSTGEEQHPFNDKFYKKILRFLNSTRPEATDDLFKMYQETLAYYEDHNWTEYWGNGDKAGKDSSEMARNKKVDKPQAPAKKEMQPQQQHQQKSSRNVSPSTNAVHPSPSSSPSAVKIETEKAEREKAKARPVTLQVAEVNIFGDDDEEVVPRKKVKKAAVESESLVEAMDDSSQSSSSDAKMPTSSTSLPPPPSQTSFASELCSVCQDPSVEIGNTMVTCDECSRLYHQNCHNPEITSSELRDPRFIFVCMQCKQKRTKATAFKSPGGPATNTQPSGTKETAAAAVRSTKSTEKAISKPQGPSLFKPVVPPAKDRIVTAAASPTTTSPVKQTGIASLAADFLAKRAGKVVLPKPALDALPKAAPVVSTTSVTSVGVGKLASTQSPSSATSSSSLTRPAPPKPIAPSPKSAPTIPPMVGAEKRLQAMKKKAAQGKSMFK